MRPPSATRRRRQSGERCGSWSRAPLVGGEVEAPVGIHGHPLGERRGALPLQPATLRPADCAAGTDHPVPWQAAADGGCALSEHKRRWLLRYVELRLSKARGVVFRV